MTFVTQLIYSLILHHRKWKLYFIGEVMAFHMFDDQAVPINRNVRIKDRLSFREHSRGITKKRLPKRTVRRFLLDFTSF